MTRSRRESPHISTSRRDAALGFDLVLFFGYHNEHLIAEDPAPTYAPAVPGYTWALMVANDSELKDWSISRLMTVEPGGVPDWCGIHPSEPQHYRLMNDHDGYYDAIAGSVDITHTMRPREVEVIEPPPWME